MSDRPDNFKYDIFISCRTTHVDWVEILAHNLNAQNYQVLLDRWALIPGQRNRSQPNDTSRYAITATKLATS